MTKRALKIGELYRQRRGFRLPLDLVTQTTAVLGIRGSGKTHTASVFAEELLEQGQQIVVIDPLDVWWGLRSSAHGRSPGYPVVVLGGDHGHLPLDAASGSVVADFVIDQRGLSMVLVTRQFSKADQRRFVQAFAERLYQRKGKAEHRTPIHLFIDEADLFAPQRIFKGSEHLFSSIDNLVRRGRASGVGVTLVSQRAAVVHKDVLTQCELLVCHRTISPQDRKAINEWVNVHDVEGVAETVLSTLHKLATGEAWFWSPAWTGDLERIRVRPRHTYDSWQTPKAGARIREPKQAAKVDLEKLRGQMSATIERAKADDPRELRREVAELKRQLAKKGRPAVDDAALEREVKKAVAASERFWRGRVAERDEAIGALRVGVKKVGTTLAKLCELDGLKPIDPPSARDFSPIHRKGETVGIGTNAAATRPQPRSRRESAGDWGPHDVRIGGGALRMIEVLADRAPARFTEAQWATLSKLKRSGGTWSTYKSRLVGAGLVDQERGLWGATDHGIVEYGDSRRAPQTSDELISEWKRRLGGGTARMIDSLVAVYPDGLSREDLGEISELTTAGGTFSTYLSRLRSNGLAVVDSDGLITATSILMEA